MIRPGSRRRTPADRQPSVPGKGDRHDCYSPRHSARRHPRAIRRGAGQGRLVEQVPDGGIAHLTWWDGADCHNVDAWDSEAAFASFGEQRLGPAMAAVGVNVQPETTFHPAHEVYLPQRVIIASTTAAHGS